jgi:hypothetical protein
MCVPSVAECRPATPRRKQVLIEPPKVESRRPFRPHPVELGRGKSLRGLGIGNVGSPSKCQRGELFAPSAPHCLDDRRIVEGTKERERRRFTVFLTHEQERHKRAEQQQATF